MTHPADAHDLAAIPGAQSFVASLFMGQGKFEKSEHATLAEAREGARLLAASHKSSRKPMVYAVTAAGTSVFVPDSYDPAKPALVTFNKRFNAQRAAKRALGGDATEGLDFVTTKVDGAWTWTIKNAADVFVAPPENVAELAIPTLEPERTDDMPKNKRKETRAKAPKIPGKRAALEAACREGKLPPVPDFSAPTHARFRNKLNEVVALVKAKDVKALKAFEINPVSSSPKAIARYRDLAILALSAR